MSFDRATRNLLANAVGKIRERLKTDVMAELRRLGFQDDGAVLDLARIGGLTERERTAAEELRALLGHLIAAEAATAGGAKARSAREIALAAYDRMAREIGFTTLNRLVALRMAEERGLVAQSIGAGMGSNGFLLYERLVSGALGSRHQTYRAYLECLYDEIGRDLPALFDRTDPHSRIFPGDRCLEDVLALLNAPNLGRLWQEDETIGWVYQYYNDPDERKKMRESQAPRTSRELAVRNQFFTPRYVVEFLTDNTLGRTWYEMRQGNTRLVEQCRYMVRRKRPVFLAPGEDPPRPYRIEDGHTDPDYAGEMWTRPNPELTEFWDILNKYGLTFGYDYARSLPGVRIEPFEYFATIATRVRDHYRETGKWQGSFEELRIALFMIQRGLRHSAHAPSTGEQTEVVSLYTAICKQWDLETEYIPNRAPKDPRDLKILDPACGSGHFLLYAFDLLATIYEEAWEAEDPHHLPAWSLRRDHPDLASLRRAIPAMILRYNLHGIDIDPRAVQIAGLALWLRAQRAYQALGLKGEERPAISHGNIVCAAPMPGERDHFTRFLADLDSPTLARIAEAMWDELALAGVAGSLLKPEERLRTIIAEERAAYQKRPSGIQQALFVEHVPPVQQALDFSDVTDARFWNLAEERILTVLREYSEAAEGGDATTRRLFAADGAQGFRFVDSLRQRYDVVLMNPPFGEAALSTRSYIAERYAESKDDMYAAFVSQFAKKHHCSSLGVISNRTGFFLAGMRRWRETALLGTPTLTLLADLGDGVLDDALVEAAAYIITQTNATCTFFRLLDQEEKAGSLHDAVVQLGLGELGRPTFVDRVESFSSFPASRISYWAPPSVREIYRSLSGAAGSRLAVKFGLSTKDDFRFLRLCWEVPARNIVTAQDEAKPARPWMFLAKGGEYALHYGDVHLVAKWAHCGQEIGASVVERYPYLNGNANWVLHSEVPYGRPGVTYTKRTTSGFSPRLLSSGCLISDKGCTIFADTDAKLAGVLAAYASRAFAYMLEFNLSSGDSVHSGSAARDYEIGTVSSVPIPAIESLSDQATLNALAIWKRKAGIDSRQETSRYFMAPWSAGLITVDLNGLVLSIRADDLATFVYIINDTSQIEKEIRQLYGFDSGATLACDAEFGPDVMGYPLNVDEGVKSEVVRLWSSPISDVIESTAKALGFSRFISKMTYVADRRIELLCHRFRTHPQRIVDSIRDLAPTLDESSERVQAILSYLVGCVLGRWDIRYAAGMKQAPELPDPFAPLPVCPSGMLQNADRLPAGAADGPADYPLRISWPGILVDDEGQAEDIECRVREALQMIWGERAEAIEAEACEILKVKALRDYFRRPASFFAHHLAQYSKSRRQAPIYWPLSTQSGSYTLWLYYHRLTSDTLYTAVNRYVLPKIAAVERDLADLGARLNAASGREATRLREEVEAVGAFRAELVAFRDELLRVAALPYRPNLNDGVIINAAPLHTLFRLPKWARDTKECWSKLERGDYDWAHLAYTIWPDRVREKCRADKSLAIAHGLEDLYVEPPAAAKKRRGRAAPPPDEEQDDGS